MADGDADEINGHGISQQDTEDQKDPRQVRGCEWEETEKGHALVRVEAAPDVDHHESEA